MVGSVPVFLHLSLSLSQMRIKGGAVERDLQREGKFSNIQISYCKVTLGSLHVRSLYSFAIFSNTGIL